MSSLFLSLLLLLLLLTTTASAATQSLLPSDAVSLLKFKFKADLDHNLLFTLNERYDYCQWRGVKCAQGRVVRLVLQGFGLRGSFPPDSLSRLDQLRVLSLSNNSLSGPVPDLSGLTNLKSLFLTHNSFSGSFPPSVLLLHRLVTLDLSFNNFSGPLPVELNSLDRLNSLKLEMNRFNGSLPGLNQSVLVIFNVTGNNLTGPIPVTPTLSKFDIKSFLLNPNLCGEIIHKVCAAPFFDTSRNATSSSSPGPLEQSAGVVISKPPSTPKKTKTKTKTKTQIVILLFLTMGFIAVIICCLVLWIVSLAKKKQSRDEENNPKSKAESAVETINEQVSNVVVIGGMKRSGNLVFCGTSEMYSLEQLMKASAELLGRGSIGTTYKAVLDNQLIVTVKRIDANKTAITSSLEFEQHMDAVGVLRHPNLVPIRAYFQAKGERLVIFDYQPNGSLFNLIHGSRSTRAKPLHWTSCLKIAEDVAQGLAYVHRESKLVHGNLKSSNVLLGTDFEACLTDYCLAVLTDSASVEDPDSAAYKAPEARKSTRRATCRSDVYSFGVLLFELLTGKHPSQHPYLAPADMLDWVRSTREDDSKEDNSLGMLIEVASVCRLTSPEQRPVMWQVLKMIQEIKERVMMEENASFGNS